MEKARLIVTVDAPMGTGEPFLVSLREIDGGHRQTAVLHPEKTAEFFLPEGTYLICVRSKSELSPGGQCKVLHARAGECYGFCAVFLGARREPSSVVNFTAQDAQYPNILTLTGGITLMAAESKKIHFVGGIATGVTLPIGTYTLAGSTIPGYEDATMEPITVTEDTTEVTLELSAAGTLTVTVADEDGTPITAGVLQLSNRDGTVKYGEPMPIVNGQVVFENVPHRVGGVDLFISQNGSDDGHTPLAAPQAVKMDIKQKTVSVINPKRQATLDASVVDVNYPDIQTMTGGVTLQKEEA